MSGRTGDDSCTSALEIVEALSSFERQSIACHGGSRLEKSIFIYHLLFINTIISIFNIRQIDLSFPASAEATARSLTTHETAGCGTSGSSRSSRKRLRMPTSHHITALLSAEELGMRADDITHERRPNTWECHTCHLVTRRRLHVRPCFRLRSRVSCIFVIDYAVLFLPVYTGQKRRNVAGSRPLCQVVLLLRSG